ncbi:hypothetical protein FRC08_007814 [Ceratobasidium sp. 394]|nr:hypothetical protein FRC08_007814 [Ceratobasidium sp. 394]
MDEPAENLTLAFDSLRRLSNDDMLPTSRHRHCTSTRIYHLFSNLTNRASLFRVLCQTFRHESLVLVLESSNRYHPAQGVPGVCEIICANFSSLLEKMEQMVRGESPDSSDEESELDNEFWEQEEYMEPEPFSDRDEGQDQDDADRYTYEVESDEDESWHYRHWL